MREKKYDWLLENDIKTTKWKKLSPESKLSYLFISVDKRFFESYKENPKIDEIFQLKSVGIVTARDNFAIDFDKDVLKRRIMMFRDLSMPDEIIRQAFKLKDTSTFKFRRSREMLSRDDNWDRYFTEILYRPFDKRNIYYTNIVVERPLINVMQHMMKENLGLLTCRQQNKVGFYHAFICNRIVESCVVSNKTREINYLLPIYIYPSTDKNEIFKDDTKTSERKPNINPKLLKSLYNVYKKEPIPEEILYYIYSFLYSNIYRSKYSEFLKIDFPRIPFTKDYKVFSKMAEYGKRLANLHLLKSPELEQSVAKFQGEGDNKIVKLKYEEEKLDINKSQYFEGIKKEVWEYQIGGYQVCDKWLKDRKERTLSLDDIKHYCKIVTSLQKTIEIQQLIDGIYQEVKKDNIIQFIE